MLAGKNNEEKIWNYLKGAGLNDFGTAGLMETCMRRAALSRTTWRTYTKKGLA